MVIEHDPPTEEAALVKLEVELVVEGGVSVPAMKCIEEQEFVIGTRSR